MQASSFAELGLVPAIMQTVESLGYTEPSPIQCQAIPFALQGRNLVGISQTGSGKTAAFALPILQRLDVNQGQQALIVCPTRELAIQVEAAVIELGRGIHKLKTIAVYGGAPMDRQSQALQRGAHIVVGTPGRLLDHLRRGSLKPNTIRYVVLDEADRMLDMGFREEVESLLVALPEDRQTLFFSATMNRNVAKLIEGYVKSPEWIEVTQKVRTAAKIKQGYYDLRWTSKRELLFRVLEMHPPTLAIVFCNTKRVVDECNEALSAMGFPADRLHGDMTQPMRERVLRRFRDGEVTILVATDVAGRGLDVDDVELVVNYDLPQDPEDYVHRVGRTGRAGREGRAITLVARRERDRLKAVERYTGQSIELLPIPSREDIETRRSSTMLATLLDQLRSGEGSTPNKMLKQLETEGFDWSTVAATIFDLWCGATTREIETIPEDHPQVETRERSTTRRQPETDRETDRETGRRPSRGEGGPPSRGTIEPDPGMVRVFVGLGDVENIRPRELVGMLYSESGAPNGVLGKLQLFNRHALIDVKEEWVDKVVKAGSRARYRGRSFRIRRDERA